MPAGAVLQIGDRCTAVPDTNPVLHCKHTEVKRRIYVVQERELLREDSLSVPLLILV